MTDVTDLSERLPLDTELGPNPLVFNIQRDSGEILGIFGFRNGTLDQELRDAFDAWLWRLSKPKLVESNDDTPPSAA